MSLTSHWSDACVDYSEGNRNAFERHDCRWSGDAPPDRHQPALLQCLSSPARENFSVAPPKLTGLLIDDEIRAVALQSLIACKRTSTEWFPTIVGVTLRVEPAWRRQKLASALLRETINWGQTLGASHLMIKCCEWNAASQAFVRKLKAEVVCSGETIAAWVPIGCQDSAPSVRSCSNLAATVRQSPLRGAGIHDLRLIRRSAPHEASVSLGCGASWALVRRLRR
jgi:hypothetical protein